MNELRLPYEQVLRRLSILSKLEPFDPILIGTPPLGIEIGDSDIDIACSAEDLVEFKTIASNEFEKFKNFLCYDLIVQNLNTTIVQFHAFGWDVELFCQNIPTVEQWGVRHFRVEQRILEYEPKLKSVIVGLKAGGMKTEPAFAAALKLSGDPYLAILDLENLDDQALSEKIANANQGRQTW